MTTIELMAIISEQCKGWNVNGTRGILPHLNAAHSILATNESEQNVYFDEANGDLPSLTTTSSDYDYTLNSNIWKLGAILVRLEDMSSVSGTLVNLTGFDYGATRYSTRPPECLNVAGRQYIRIPFVRSWVATETANARCMFSANPGTTSDYYKQYGFKIPTSITSTSVQVDIPPPWDYQFLIPATVKLIEAVQHGNYMEAREYVTGVLKPALQREMNGGEQGFDYDADERGF